MQIHFRLRSFFQWWTHIRLIVIPHWSLVHRAFISLIIYHFFQNGLTLCVAVFIQRFNIFGFYVRNPNIMAFQVLLFNSLQIIKSIITIYGPLTTFSNLWCISLGPALFLQSLTLNYCCNLPIVSTPDCFKLTLMLFIFKINIQHRFINRNIHIRAQLPRLTSRYHRRLFIHINIVWIIVLGRCLFICMSLEFTTFSTWLE